MHDNDDHQKQFLEAPLLRQAEGELKNSKYLPWGMKKKEGGR